jgi:hypothetical protein
MLGLATDEKTSRWSQGARPGPPRAVAMYEGSVYDLREPYGSF